MNNEQNEFLVLKCQLKSLKTVRKKVRPVGYYIPCSAKKLICKKNSVLTTQLLTYMKCDYDVCNRFAH